MLHFFHTRPIQDNMASSAKQDYTSAAKEWLAKDPDAKSRATLQSFLDNNDTKALDQAFGDRLAFGTAGLRGVLGVGPNNMNVRRLL